MIFAVDAYDASETTERPNSAYLSRKDVRIAGIFFFLLALIITPIFLYQKRQADKHICNSNFAQIAKALTVYMEAHDGRFPPAFDEDPRTGQPMLIDGLPSTWMTQIYSGMERRASFKCPSARPDEIAENLNPEKSGTSFASTYGYYAIWSAYPQSLAPNPDDTVIVAETANRGGNGTFDPKPFDSSPDGAIIGWNDSNTKPTSESSSVTRLAFPNTAKGMFTESGLSRHDNGIHVLYMSLRYAVIRPNQALVNRTGKGGELTGLWATP